jgi:hypothetical protein
VVGGEAHKQCGVRAYPASYALVCVGSGGQLMAEGCVASQVPRLSMGTGRLHVACAGYAQWLSVRAGARVYS